MAKKLFEYEPFIKYKGEVTEENGKRQYESVCGLKCASTTTVLSAYEEKGFLGTWQDKMRTQGLDPDEISAESARIGTLAHEYVENYLLWGEYCLGNNVENKLAMNAIDNFYSYVNPDMANAEMPLFYDGMLQKNPEPFKIAGRYDNLIKIDSNVFQYKNGQPLEEQFMIADLKTKRSYQRNKNNTIKTKALPRSDRVDMVFKNCLQLSMYSAVLSLQSDFKERYGAGITGAALVYCNEEVTKVLHLDRKMLNYYWRVFKDILRDFYGIKPLGKTWRQLISSANGGYNYETEQFEDYVPKEITLIKP
jgi:hypothetical protein